MAHLVDVLDSNVVLRQRRSRIRLLGRYFDYPLRASNVLRGLPPGLLVRALLDYAWARARECVRPGADEHFEAWVLKRFGRTLYELFFGPYTSKAWRMPCTRISADWASQRISQKSLLDTIRRTLWPPRDGEVRSLVSEFYYPATGGIGELARSYERKVRDLGGDVRLGTSFRSIEVKGGRAVAVTVDGKREVERIEPDHIVNTTPLPLLVRSLAAGGASVSDRELDAARSLEYVAILFVYLEVQRPRVMPDHWVYLPSPELAVHRVSEFKNFSDASAPGGTTAVCCEITCRKGDERWRASDEELAAMARRDLVQVGLLSPGEGRKLDVARLERAYPVYDLEYRGHLQTLRAAVRRVGGLTTTGRQGLFRYNNMDHSIAMGRKIAASLGPAQGAPRPRAPGSAQSETERVAAGPEYFG